MLDDIIHVNSLIATRRQLDFLERRVTNDCTPETLATDVNCLLRNLDSLNLSAAITRALDELWVAVPIPSARPGIRSESS
jgi:hypothetical protein